MLGKISKSNQILIIIFSGLLLVIAIITTIIILINNDVLFGTGLPRSCADLSGPELADCVSDESYTFLSENNCAKALEVYEKISPNSVDLNTLVQIYSYAVSTSMACEDENAIEEWQSKRWTVTKLINEMEKPL